MNRSRRSLHHTLSLLRVCTSWLIFTVPTVAFSQSIIEGNGLGPAGCDFDTGWMSHGCIISFLQHLVEFAFGLTGGFFLIMLFVGGYEYAIGSAVPGKDTSAGKQRIQFAIIGFLVTLLSFFIIEFIVALFTGQDLSP